MVKPGLSHKYSEMIFPRMIIDDGREPNLLTGLPMETDAEYRVRLLAVPQTHLANQKAPVVAMAEAVPAGVKFTITEDQNRFVANVETDRPLNDTERNKIVDAAKEWMLPPGFDITFTEKRS